ncbi:YnjH family protein [Vibrio harveyi]|uniref:YnjH family protein n=1 Tax=Vibrio harveyi TaxID=669 RepID=UPI002380944F|nr:YnjH family protein [Vibrio harveyi]EKO3845782.1 YnjH family protein [Vibrio harveyi]
MNVRSISVLLASVAAVLSSFAMAKSYNTPDSKALVVADGKLGQRVCYYDDKAYTTGAVLNIDGVLLMCTDENDFETNGSLKWVVFQKDKK